MDVCDIISGQSPPGRTYNVEGIDLPCFQGKAEYGANLTENAAKITSLSLIERKYVCFWLSSNVRRSFIADKTIATTQSKLALFRIEIIPIPLPPLAEQERIVAEVERRFIVIEEVKQGFREGLTETKRDFQKQGRTIGEWFRETGQRIGEAIRQMGKDIRKFFTGK